MGDVNAAPHRPQPPQSQPAPESAQSTSNEGYFTYYGGTSQVESPSRSNGQTQHAVTHKATNNGLGEEVSKILQQGQRLGIEYVDQRRFRTGAWQSFGSYQGDVQEAIAALNTCTSDHPRDYIRLVSIDPNSRRRIAETIVQRPDSRK